jgi:ceramide glucosyltransferase
VTGAEIAALALATLDAGLVSTRSAFALRYAARYPVAGESDGEGVAILQAILSGDPLLAERLEANLTALPRAHFYWLIDDDDPEAHRITRAILERTQASVSRESSPPPPSGINPKMWKLDRVLPRVTEETLVVLDDDTILPRLSLGALVAGLARATVTTGLPRYADDGRFASRLLSQFVNQNAAVTYLMLPNFRPPITLNGMTWAMRRAELDKLGGFGPIVRCLTDDLAIARIVSDAGGSIEQTPYLQHLQTSLDGVGHYFRLLHRWFLFVSLLLARQPLSVIAFIGVFLGTPPALLWGLVVLALVARSPIAIGALALTLVVRWVWTGWLDVRIARSSFFGRPLLSLVSELLQPIHLVHATLWRRIVWRKRRYRVLSDEDFRPIE